MSKLKSEPSHISKTVIIYKFVTGIIELILGLGILFFGRNISRVYAQYKIRELLDDPHDILITSIDKVVAPIVIHHRIYLMILLITLGIVKIIGAIGLMRNKEWGLDLLIVLFLILLPFDTFSLITHPSYLKFFYFMINLLIALYLMEFKPFGFIRRLKRYIKK